MEWRSPSCGPNSVSYFFADSLNVLLMFESSSHALSLDFQGCLSDTFETIDGYDAQRNFLQVEALFSPQFRQVFNGGFVFEYSTEKVYSEQTSPYPFTEFGPGNYGVGYFSPEDCNGMDVPCEYIPKPEFYNLASRYAAVDVSSEVNLNMHNPAVTSSLACPDEIPSVDSFEWPTETVAEARASLQCPVLVPVFCLGVPGQCVTVPLPLDDSDSSSNVESAKPVTTATPTASAKPLLVGGEIPTSSPTNSPSAAPTTATTSDTLSPTYEPNPMLTAEPTQVSTTPSPPATPSGVQTTDVPSSIPITPPTSIPASATTGSPTTMLPLTTTDTNTSPPSTTPTTEASSTTMAPSLTATTEATTNTPTFPPTTAASEEEDNSTATEPPSSAQNYGEEWIQFETEQDNGTFSAASTTTSGGSRERLSLIVVLFFLCMAGTLGY